MIDETSIEAMKERIFSPITKKYFEEVYSCYIHNNYRSAIVMLWSVIILDAVEKLQQLKSQYQDLAAITILDSINTLKEEDPTASAWERRLIKEISEKTGLMDRSEYLDLEHIQQQRHLSAHPILKGKTELHTPNKDTTRALIRNALEIILIKPPLYASKILENIQADLDENGYLISLEREEFRTYLRSKYFEKMNKETKLKVFRTYWKFVMHLDNENSRKTRPVNHRFLILLALDNLPDVLERMKRDQIFYSKIVNGESIMLAMAIFLNEVPSAYKLLTPDTKILIKRAVEDKMELRIISYFKEESLQAHHQYLQNIFKEESCMEPISSRRWDELKSASDSKEMDGEFIKTISIYYSESARYDTADSTANSIIRYIDSFDITSFKYLLELAENNAQTYERNRAYIDYATIKDKILELDSNFDFKPYPRFRRALPSKREESITTEE